MATDVDVPRLLAQLCESIRSGSVRVEVHRLDRDDRALVYLGAVLAFASGNVTELCRRRVPAYDFAGYLVGLQRIVAEAEAVDQFVLFPPLEAVPE